MTNQVDTVKMASDANKELRSVASNLRFFATSFFNIGNEKMAEELRELAQDIELNAKNAYDAYSLLLTEAFQSSQESTGNIIKAALTGLEISKKRSR